MVTTTTNTSIDETIAAIEEGMQEVMLGQNEDEKKPLAVAVEGQQQMYDKQAVEPQEHAPTTIPATKGPAKTSADDTSMKRQKRLRLGLLMMSLLGLCIVIAVLVALLPDWSSQSNNFSTRTSTSTDLQAAVHSNSTTFSSSATPLFFMSQSDSPFQAQLPLFSADNIANPYTNREEVRSDLQHLARLFLNNFIVENMGYGNNGGIPESMPITSVSAPDDAREPLPEGATSAATTDAAAGNGGAFADVDDFGTYQQEQGVVRSDTVKSDGVYIFTASEDKILVLDLDGQLLKTVSMPPVEIPFDPNGQVKPGDTVEFVPSEQADTSAFNSSGSASSTTTTAEARSSFIPPYNPKPYIQAMLLDSTNQRLVAVVSGYGINYYYYGGYPEATTSSGDTSVFFPPIVSDSKQTKIIVYSIGEGGELTEVSQKTVDGNHVNSYSVGSNIHIVTRTYLNVWPFLYDPIQRWQPDFQGMDDEEYKISAMAKSEKLIDDFVNAMLELDVSLSRISVFTDSLPDDAGTSERPFFYADVLPNTITEVLSFDVETVEPGSELSVSSSSTLQPGSWGYVYATKDWLWVADQGWSWIQEEMSYADKTMLLGFRLNGPSTSLAAAGSVPGSLLSQFAIDFVSSDDANEDFIRVATTLDLGWRFWGAPVSSAFDAESEGVSRTKNQVIILEVPSSGKELIRRGSVELGEPNEVITAVRFFDDISYVVTFERTDPFYVLDLSNVDNPVVLGELKVPGFSQFMHPIKDGTNKMLISVGQAANDDGMTTGLQISIFNSTVPTEPTLVDRLLVENNPNQSSSTSAAFDERAFRYLQVGDLGRLIIPVTMYSSTWDQFGNYLSDSFEGFALFGIDLSKTEGVIETLGMINHTRPVYSSRDPTFDGCYCYTQLPERSLVFGGDVVTMKNQRIVSTDLTSQETQWTLELKDSLQCCPSF